MSTTRRSFFAFSAARNHCPSRPLSHTATRCIPMTEHRTKESGSKENVEWAYDVVGSGLTIYTLCDLKAERDALREALAEIVRRERRSEYSSIYAAPGEFAAVALAALDGLK